MPDLFIITGSNGAGKSSVGWIYLPEHIRATCQVFDGDKLFMQKQRELWAQGIRSNKEAKKLAYAFVEETFDGLVEDALAGRKHFVYEGHFTNDATWDIPKRFKSDGYTINLIFLGLKNPELSDLRVIDRAQTGGHYVDPLTVRDNFYGNLAKLNKHFDVIDWLTILDTSDSQHIQLINFSNGSIVQATPYSQMPEWVINYLPRLSALLPS